MSADFENFEHACFISYKHPPKNAKERHFYKEFAEMFRERLEFYLNGPLRTYLDVDADVGSSYPQELSQKLCKSVCMIAVLVPEYPDSNWCLAEWEAMEKLEAKRLGEGKRGLIIPIALRRSADEWNAVFKRKPLDFSKVSVPKTQLKNIKHSEKIQKIAEQIAKLISEVNKPCEDCGKFQFTVGIEELKPNPTFTDPSPFA